MVTMAQINRLDSRIDELAERLGTKQRLQYHVELVWIQPDGSIVDDDCNPYVPQPGVITLDFGDPRWSQHPSSAA